jgi:hypothetical protein
VIICVQQPHYQSENFTMYKQLTRLVMVIKILFTLLTTIKQLLSNFSTKRLRKKNNIKMFSMNTNKINNIHW